MMSEKTAIVDGDYNDWKTLALLANLQQQWSICSNDYNVYRQIFTDINMMLFRVAKKDNISIGCIIRVQYPNQLAIIAFYFVRREFRGVGIGKRLFDNVFNDDADRINFGLNSRMFARHLIDLFDFINNYTKSQLSTMYAEQYGFDKFQSFFIQLISIAIDNNRQIIIPTNELICEIVPFNESQLEKVIEFDRRVTGGLNRNAFVRHWLQHADGWSKIALDKSTGNVIGYGVIRLSINDRHLLLMPVYADSDVVAKQLIYALVNDRHHQMSTIKQPSIVSGTATLTHGNSLIVEMRLNSNKINQILSIIGELGEITLQDSLFIQFNKQVPNICVDMVYSTADRVTYV